MRWLWIVSLFACSLFACGRAPSEESLGLGTGRTVKVDVKELATPTELLHALQLPGAEQDKALGAHRLEARSSLQVGGVEKLEESYQLDSDGKGAYHLIHDNARDGLEATFAGGVLYARPRYGHWTRRRPEGDDIERTRDNVEGVAAGYLELLQRWLTVKELARTEVAGRPAVKLQLSARSQPSSGAAETRAYRKWRDTVKVAALNGEWTLDAGTGAPLAGKLEASYSFERSGGKGPMTVKLSWEQHLAAVQPIVAPADAVEPRRPRPLVDKDTLLDGLKTAH